MTREERANESAFVIHVVYFVMILFRMANFFLEFATHCISTNSRRRLALEDTRSKLYYYSRLVMVYGCNVTIVYNIAIL